MLRIIIPLLVIIITCCTSGKKNNWPQYLGADRNATIENVQIAESWPTEGPKKLWSVEVGPGYGGASVYDDEVFILDRIKGEKDVLKCIDLNTGDEKWSYSYNAPGELPYPGSRSVPTVDENYIWMVGPHGHFNCIDKKTHRPIWTKELVAEYDIHHPQWGVSQSPLIYNDLVIVSPQGTKAGCVAFKKLTGEVAWESRPYTGGVYYVSPVLATIEGVDQVINICPYDRKDSTKVQEVVAFNAQTGEELWKYDGLKSMATITPATIIGENKVFLTDCSYNGRFDPVSILLEISKEDEGFEVKEIFKTEEAGCKMHPAVVHYGYLYLNSTGKPQQMVCLSMEGKMQWKNESAPGFDLGALIKIGDFIINQNGKNGAIHLIKPTPEKYIELAKAELFGNEKTQAWAPMAYANGKLLVRNLKQMICVDLVNP